MKAKVAITVVVALGIAIALLRPRDPAAEVAAAGEIETEAAAEASTTRSSSLLLARSSGSREPRETYADFLNRLSEGGVTNVATDIQINAFLERNRGSADAYLAAMHADHSTNRLVEAALRNPDDPRIQMQMIARNLNPEDRRAWIERLKESAPDNPLAWYYSANEHLRAGERDAAFQDLAEAEGMRSFDDYVRDTIQAAEELYLDSGYSPAQAKALAAINTQMPHLQQMRDLGRQLGELGQSYAQAGDTQSAEAIAALNWRLGEQFTSSAGDHFLLNELVGMVIQRDAVQSLPQDSTYGFLPGTPEELLAGYEAERQRIKAAGQSFDLIYTLDEQQLIHYFDRQKLYGERAALDWLITRHGPRQ